MNRCKIIAFNLLYATAGYLLPLVGDNYPYLNVIENPSGSYQAFENQFYKLSNSGGKLLISDQIGSGTILNEVFPSRQVGHDEYLLFRPPYNSSGEYFYFDPDNLDFNGSIVVTPYVAQSGVVSNDISMDDLFGFSLEINDWNDTIVGAPGYNSNSGSIYIFSRDANSNLAQTGKIDPDFADQGYFGGSLDSYSDWLFVGAPNANSLDGKVVVYKRVLPEGNYSRSSSINDPTANDESFGHKISAHEQDGVIAISPMVTNINRYGRVELFELQLDGSWQHLKTIWSENNESGNYFGSDHSVSGNNLIVGAPKESAGGLAYIFTKANDGNWDNLSSQTLVSSTLSPNDDFGNSVEISEEFAFVGAINGDGNLTNAGVVYVFEKTLNSWQETAKIIPPFGSDSQSFGLDLECLDDLLVISALGVGEAGMGYVYKMHDGNSSDWRLVSKLDNNGTNPSVQQSLPIATKKGNIILGSPDDTNSAGSIKAFRNNAWQAHQTLPLAPLFVSETNSSLVIDEDSIGGVLFDFQAEHPFESNFTWSVISGGGSPDTYSLSANDGVFSYFPESNFSGVINFTIQAQSLNGANTHDFSVQINPIPDSPIFDSNQSTELTPTWIGEAYSQFINVFDSDSDSNLTLHAVSSLPNGLSIVGHELRGVITEDLEGHAFKDLNFSLRVSDGTGTPDSVKEFSILVYEENFPPSVEDINGSEVTDINLTLQEDFNEIEWFNALGALVITDDKTATGHFTFSIYDEPMFGIVELNSSNESIIYSSNQDFNGTDTFSIKIDDNSTPSKSFILPFTILVEPVNDAPVITSQLLVNAYEGFEFNYTIQWSDIVDGDTTHTVEVSGLPEWLVFNENTKSITNTRNILWSDFTDEALEVALKVTDQSGLSDIQMLEISVVPINYPPRFYQSDHNLTFNEDNLLTLPLTIYDSDEVDGLVYWQSLTPPTNGEVAFPSSGYFGNVYYTPDANFTGYDHFEILIYDPSDSNATDILSVSLNVLSVEDNPVITPKPYYTDAVVGYPWLFQYEGLDGDLNQSISLQSDENVLPAWLTQSFPYEANFSEAIIQGVPSVNDIGSFQILLNVTDSSGFTGTEVFEVNVLENNFAPIINEGEFLSVNMSEDGIWEKHNPLSSLDENRQRQTWSVAVDCEHGDFNMSFDNNQLTYVRYVPSDNFYGADSVTLMVTDGIDQDFFTYNFSVLQVDDIPYFTTSQDGQEFRVEDNNHFLEKFEFKDGDSDISNFSVIGHPTWLNIDDSNFTNGSLTLFGTPDENDEGNTTINFSIFDSLDNNVTISFGLEVFVENYSPEIIFVNDNLSITEDSPKVKLGDLSVSDPDQTSNHNWDWTQPANGEAMINNNFELEYTPDANFTGSDSFTIRVTDSGIPVKYAELNIDINVSAVDDIPVFRTQPDDTVFEDEEYFYRFEVFDGDLPNDELSITATDLPQWLTFTIDANNSGTISGSGKVEDEGLHPVKIVAIDNQGNQATQRFFINLKVRDYPPIFKSNKTDSYLEQVTLFIKEDHHVTKWSNPQGFSAFNPDPEFDDYDQIEWSLLSPSSNGSTVSVGGSGAKPPEFYYKPPVNFVGKDTFSLLMNEGDRESELIIEVVVSPIPDRPIFSSELESKYSINAGEIFQINGSVFDVDSDEIQLRLIAPSWDTSNWLEISEFNTNEGFTLRGEPKTSVKGNLYPYTLMVLDETGLYSTIGFSVEVNGENSSPTILPEEIDVVFDQAGDVVSDISSIHATDLDGDPLIWTVDNDKKPLYGQVLLEGNSSLPSMFKFIPSALEANGDAFTIQVSDGINSDTVIVNPIFNWEGNVSVVGEITDFSIKETQGFHKQMSFYPDNHLEVIDLSIQSAPHWVNLLSNQLNTFTLSGIAPYGSGGNYDVELLMKGEETSERLFNFQIKVLNGRPPKLEKIGDSVIRLTSFEPFIEPGISAVDFNGYDISERVEITSNAENDIFDLNYISYSVTDENGNSALTQRITRRYTESPIKLSSSRVKVRASKIFTKWMEDDQIDLIGQGIDVIENGPDNFVFNQGYSRLSFRYDFLDHKLDNLFEGDAVEFLSSCEIGESIFILGKFSGQIKISDVQVFTATETNFFLASFSHSGEFNWLKPFNSVDMNTSVFLSKNLKEELVISGNTSGSIFWDRDVEIIFEQGFDQVFHLTIGNDGSLGSHHSMIFENMNLQNFEFWKKNISYVSVLQNADVIKSEASLVLLDEEFEESTRNDLSSSNYLKINDIELDDDRLIVVGEFKGLLKVGSQSVLEESLDSGFVIALNRSLELQWAKSLSSSQYFNIREVELDHLGDILICSEFSEEINIDGVNEESLGGRDIIVSLLSANDGKFFWHKKIGGTGDESVHDFKLNRYGNPFILFQNSADFTQDNKTFSTTGSSEYHLVRMIPYSGEPSISMDKLVISELGSFSHRLDAVHPEHLYFEISNAPKWLRLDNIENEHGSVLLHGYLDNISEDEMNIIESNGFKVSAFTIDGGFLEKIISIEFERDENFEKRFELLPPENAQLGYSFGKYDRVGLISAHPNGGWLVFGDFPSISNLGNLNLGGNFQKSLLHLHQQDLSSPLMTLTSNSPFRVSDIQISNQSEILLFGNFSGKLKIANQEIRSNGESDIFLITADLSGSVLSISHFGSLHSETANKLIIQDDKIFINGSFENSSVIAGLFVESIGGRDIFLACLDKQGVFYEANWVKRFGGTKDDSYTDMTTWRDENLLLAVCGDVDYEMQKNFADGAKNYFKILKIDINGTRSDELFYSCSGRIRNPLIKTLEDRSGLLIALEFEKNLSLLNGKTISSRGGFDIYSSSLDQNLNPSIHFSQVGGSWNDRLTSLNQLGQDSYTFSINFFQSIFLNEKSIASNGSSDAILVKSNLHNHQLIDYFTYGSGNEDRIDLVKSLSEHSIAIVGKTSKANGQNLLDNNEVYTQLTVLGDYLSEPSVLKGPPAKVDSSYPFSFSIETGPWLDGERKFVIADYEDESSYHWITTSVDDSGMIQFSGIAPNVEVGIPFDFSIIEQDFNMSLRVSFTLSVLNGSNSPPVADILSDLELSQGELFEYQFSYHDLEGDIVSFYLSGPDWITLEEIDDYNAKLLISAPQVDGDFSFETTLVDHLGNSSLYHTRLKVERIVSEQNSEISNIDWFGYHIDYENGWSYHFDFGWLFLAHATSDSVWVWKEGWGWLWSNSDLWVDDGSGYFFNELNSNWLYWSSVEKRIYDYEFQKWEEF